MATTKSLTSDNSVFVTTFYGGAENGRQFTITVAVDGVLVSRTFTQDQLITVLCEGGTVRPDSGIRPEFDS